MYIYIYVVYTCFWHCSVCVSLCRWLGLLHSHLKIFKVYRSDDMYVLIQILHHEESHGGENFLT